MASGNRNHQKVHCPVDGCDSHVKSLQLHLNNYHRDISLEEFAEKAGKSPYNFLRCAACHFATVAIHGIRTHKCDRRFQDIAQLPETPPLAIAHAEQEQEDNEGSVVHVQEPIQEDAEGSIASDDSYFEGDHVEDFRDPPGAAFQLAFMKQPAMETLPKVPLSQFEAIVVKLLEMALPADGEDGPVDQRALEALYNLPGCLRNAEYRAGGVPSSARKS